MPGWKTSLRRPPTESNSRAGGWGWKGDKGGGVSQAGAEWGEDKGSPGEKHPSINSEPFWLQAMWGVTIPQLLGQLKVRLGLQRLCGLGHSLLQDHRAWGCQHSLERKWKGSIQKESLVAPTFSTARRALWELGLWNFHPCEQSFIVKGCGRRAEVACFWFTYLAWIFKLVQWTKSLGTKAN